MQVIMRFRDNHEENAKVIANLHEGHRSRLRERLVRTNFSGADDYQVLEYILTLPVKRRDTNELAHRLINHFGKLADVFDASQDELLKVEGMTPTIAYFIHSIPYIFRNYKLSKIRDKEKITCAQDIFMTLGESIFHLPNEEFYIMCLDAKNALINKELISLGGTSQVLIDTKEVVQRANKVNARKVVLVHNHPTGEAVPSVEDIETTKRLYMAFNMAGIELFDHMIVNGEEEFYSFAHEGLLKRYEDEYNKFIKTDKLTD